jgi:hypothetical protein
VAALAVGAVLLSGCAAAAHEAAPTGTGDAATPPAVAAPPGETASAASYDLCAEFPARPPTGQGDLEGWWSSTPANPDGSVIEDPALWPEPKMVQHPRTAVVDVESGEVLSTWDRTTCTDVPGFVPTPDDRWPAVSDDARELVVVDVDTGEVVNTTLASVY